MKDFKLKLQALGIEALTRAQMKNVNGGTIPPSGDLAYCYKCCSDLTLSLCGQCDSTGNGQCQGKGIPVGCYCG